MEQRPSKHEIFLEIAKTLAKRGTCARRQVGCVLVNEHSHVIGTGYNGVGVGLDHCTDHPCAGAKLAQGTGLEVCKAIHAEQNALLQCRNVQEIHTAYTTCSPCMQCAKLFLNTGVKQVIFSEVYGDDHEPIWLMTKAGVKVYGFVEGELWQF